MRQSQPQRQRAGDTTPKAGRCSDTSAGLTFGVEFIPLRFETPEVVLLVSAVDFERLDLLSVVAPEASAQDPAVGTLGLRCAHHAAFPLLTTMHGAH